MLFLYFYAEFIDELAHITLFAPCLYTLLYNMGQKNKEFGRASYPASNSRSLTHTKIQFHKSSHSSDMLVSLQSYYRLTLVIHASY